MNYRFRHKARKPKNRVSYTLDPTPKSSVSALHESIAGQEEFETDGGRPSARSSKPSRAKKLEVMAPGAKRNKKLERSADQSRNSKAFPEDSFVVQKQTTLQFIIRSLSQTLEIHEAQASALLTNNQKFLLNLFTKGMKVKNFSRIIEWYRYAISQRTLLVSLLEQEQSTPQNLGNVMGVFKCGLFSLNVDVARIACVALIRIKNEIDSRHSN